MIELESFSVQGYRSLADVVDIPVRSPTILTGANDGGKSSCLRALDFFLGGASPDETDFTVLGRDGGTATLPHQEILVQAVLQLDAEEQAELGLAHEVALRRRFIRDLGESRYELRSSEPKDPHLRGLGDLKLADLKNRAEQFELEPTGRRNVKASWLEPLQAKADGAAREEVWIDAPKELVQDLPRFLLFSSTDEPDPEQQIRSALKAAYEGLLDNADIVGPVRQVEDEVRTGLVESASALCDHVASRCPELEAIRVEPEVAFRDGFGGVKVLAARPGSAGVALDRAGAGRRRRVNLAIWEWVGALVERDGRSVVIAYDEPDTHLDYTNQRELVGLIHEQSQMDGARVLVATHALNLVDRVDINDVVHFRLEDEQTVMDRLGGDDHDAIDDYLLGVSSAMGLRNSVLLHERCFVGVEGPTEVQAVPILFRLVTGMSLQSAGVALISGSGNDGALNVVRFLKEHGRTLVFLVVDADSADNKLFSRDNLGRVGISSDEIEFVGAREMEDLFTDEQWAATANAKWPRTDHREWAPEDFAALRESSKFSSAIENAVRGLSLEAPQGKPGYLFALVQELRDAEAVPEELVAVFQKLKASAME